MMPAMRRPRRATRRPARLVSLALALVLASLSGRASAMDEYGADYRYRPYMPLFGSGTAVFLASYVPAFGAAAPTSLRALATFFYATGTAGQACDAGKPDYVCSGDFGAAELLIPLAGPFIFALDHPKDSAINPHGLPVSDSTRTLLFVDGAAQLGGAALMLTGMLMGHWERDAAGSPVTGALTVTPLLGGGRLGLSLQLTGM